MLRHVLTNLLRLELETQQAAVLLEIVENPGASTGVVAQHLEMSKPAVTRATQRLRNRGLITSTPDADDRRRVHLQATDDGRLAIKTLGTAP